LNRSIGVTLVVGLAMLLVLGLVFSVAYGSRRITTSAAALHDADEALRSATVARAQLALAVHMGAVDRQFGTNSSQAQQVSLEEAELALADFDTAIGRLDDAGLVGNDDLRSAVGEFAASASHVLESLGSGDVSTARAVSEARLTSDFGVLSSRLVEVRDGLGTSVSHSDQLLGRIGNVARFLVAFFIPAAVILIYRELARRQHRQRELETRLEAERQLGAARERFIANASHELRTPLTSILGMAMVLAENDAIRGDPTAAEMLDIIVGESDDLARMVEDLLTVARLDAGALHYSFDDVAIAEEVAALVEPLRLVDMHVTVRCEEALVRVDRLRLRQVLRNLLSNARKYGGPNVRVEGRVDGRTFVCVVADDGEGIPEEIAGRLFQRFIHQGHQTASTESVGLGLSIVHALTNGMGGSVVHERIAGETRFVLRIPLAAGEDPYTAPDDALRSQLSALAAPSAADAPLESTGAHPWT
jgi:signal transduction histidine kinase